MAIFYRTWADWLMIEMNPSLEIPMEELLEDIKNGSTFMLISSTENESSLGNIDGCWSEPSTELDENARDIWSDEDELKLTHIKRLPFRF